MFFSGHARKVYILCRGDDLRKSMSDYLVRQIEARDDIEVLLDTNVVAVEGEDVYIVGGGQLGGPGRDVLLRPCAQSLYPLQGRRP